MLDRVATLEGGLRVSTAEPADRPGILTLLERCGLPLAGAGEPGTVFHLARSRSSGEIVGCVGIEPHGEEALLRSLAVAPAARGRGLGELLAAEGIELARALRARRVWLLTTTAERFFPRFGFAPVERAALPAALEASEELRGACPASAVAMRLDLEA
jgi:N-acetylglutamate synthase-like GNAT family acetyltransferase